MKAIIMGIWIVSIECKINYYFCKYGQPIDFDQQKGLEESLKLGHMCNENEFEAEGSQKLTKSNGPFKGLNHCQV